jgi:hypothetical protein
MLAWRVVTDCHKLSRRVDKCDRDYRGGPGVSIGRTLTRSADSSGRVKPLPFRSGGATCSDDGTATRWVLLASSHRVRVTLRTMPRRKSLSDGQHAPLANRLGWARKCCRVHDCFPLPVIVQPKDYQRWVSDYGREF